MQNNRFDLYFSYWILLWLVFIILFYKKGILPFYSFILALLYHTTIVIYTFILNKKKNNITYDNCNNNKNYTNNYNI